MRRNNTLFFVFIMSSFLIVGCTKPRTYETTFEIPIYYINNFGDRKFIIENDTSVATLIIHSTEELNITEDNFKVIMNMQECNLEEAKCIVKLSCETTLENKKLDIIINPAQVTIEFVD